MPLASPGGYRKRDDYTGRQFGGGEPIEYEGVLETALAATDCVYDAPTSATARRLARRPATRELYDPSEEEISSSASSVQPKIDTVYNSDPDLFAPAGAYCRWKVIGGILQFTYVSCDDSTAGCTSSSTGGV